MVIFSVALLTYNRQQLLPYAITSIVTQDYEQFELIVIDNGSEPPVKDIVLGFKDQRVEYFRYNKNIHVCDALESALSITTGTHFLFIADDDVLVPGALRRVANFFEAHPDAEMLGGGFADFNHTDKTSKTTLKKLRSFDGRVEAYDGEENAMYYCNGWGIGAKKFYRAAPMAHSSAIFISTALLRRTKQRQGVIFVKPFGDIGYVGCSSNTTKVYYLHAPLAIVGETPVREMVGSAKGQRRKWDKEIQYLEYSPLKSPSFINMGMDAHLKIMFANNLHDKLDTRLRPYFFRQHLRQIMSDSPWDSRTIYDIFECFPHYAKSLWHFFSIRLFIKKLVLFPISLVNNIIKRNLKKQQNKISAESKIFTDIIDFARWVNDLK